MKRSVWLCLMVMMVGCLVLANSAPVRAEGNELVIGDFNTGDKPNNIGGDFGSWDKDPNDETQSSQISFEAEDALGERATGVPHLTGSGLELRQTVTMSACNQCWNSRPDPFGRGRSPWS